MKDATKFQEIKAAPQVVFEQLATLSDEPRFMLPNNGGGWTEVSWGEFAGEIRAVAMFLDGSAVAAAERCAVYAPNRIQWASAALGIQAVGATMVPIYPGNTASQAGYVISHSDTRVLFVDTETILDRVFQAWDSLPADARVVLLTDDIDPAAVLSRRDSPASGPSRGEVLERVLTWSQMLAHGRAHDQRNPARFEEMLNSIDLDLPGMMLYTSGTTGNPKGVPLTHRNVGTNGRDWLNVLHPLVDEGSVDLLWLPMSHVFGFGELCLGNQLGFTSYFTDPKTVLELLPSVKPNVFMSVPSYWEKLAIAAQRVPEAQQHDELMRLTGGNLRFCLSGGAGLKKEIKEFFYRNSMLIIEGYGLTECSPTLTMNRPDDFDFTTVGKPFPSVELKLADDGEIMAKGPNVFSGYHKDPEATAACFTEDRWFKTGDLGEVTDRGFLRIIGRKKEILVTAGGKNVPPANVEMHFADDPLIDHFVIYGDGKKYLVAGVWLSQDGLDQDRAEVAKQIEAKIAEVNSTLASCETVKKFEIFDKPLTVENGLLTPSLKIKRKRIYETYGDRLEALYQGPAR